MLADKFDNFIFDLDGTVWWWTQPVPGAAKAVKRLQAAGKDVYFITNNCVLTQDGFVKKLRAFGIRTDTAHIINPIETSIGLFRGKKVFVIGEGILQDLRAGGVKLVRSGATAVIVSEDRHVTYGKLADATQAVWEGAKGYKTAAGGVWSMGRKKTLGAGAIAAALEAATRQEFELLGKPSEHMVRFVKRLKLNPRKTLIVGDEMGSDVALGKRLGYKTALVLTGRDNMNDYRKAAKKERPDYVLKSMADITKK